MKKAKNLVMVFLLGFFTFLPMANVNALEITSEEELRNAIATANNGDTVILKQDVTLTAPLEINKNITIDGANNTITGGYTGTTGNQSLITALENGNVTLANVNLSNSPKYGVHAYDGGKVILNGVTIKDCTYGAILVNAGTIEVKKLTLGHNGSTENKGIEISKSKYLTSTNNPKIIMNGTIDSKEIKDVIYIATDANDANPIIILENAATTVNNILVDRENKNIVVTDANDFVVFESNTLDDTKLNNIKGDEVSYVTLTFKALGEEETIKIPTGTKISESEAKQMLEEMKKALEKEGYELIGFYIDEDYQTEFDFTQEFTQDATIYVKLTEKATIDDEIENPDTADINVIVLLSVVVVSGLGIAYTIKKRKFN